MAITHSSKLGGHIAWMSPRYWSGPLENIDSLAFKLARDSRDIVECSMGAGTWDRAYHMNSDIGDIVKTPREIYKRPKNFLCSSSVRFNFPKR